MAKRITDFFSSVPKKIGRQDQTTQNIVQHLESEPIASCSDSFSSCHNLENIHEQNKSNFANFGSHNELENIKDDQDCSKNQQSTQIKSVEWYKGSKLDASWLLQTYSCLEKIKLGKRFGIKCTICFKHIQEAQKFSKNGRVPIADGVRCDDQKALERIIDHLKTEAHKAADNLDRMHQKWTTQSDQHPWIKSLKTHNAEKIKLLIELAVDVYNDSRQLTLSAHSWPSRSLSKIHADTQIASYKDDGLASQVSPLNPSPALLQYRNPVIYREMLDIVGSIVMENVIEQLKKSDCFSLQVDGSVDKFGVDNKFITARFITEDKEMHSVFLGESKSDKRGAEGLLGAIKLAFQHLGIEDLAKKKLTGLTTDGEYANTGKKSGLWVRMKQYLARDLLCLWCTAHRSDLALSDLESSVTEVAHWKNNIKAIATYYRGSAIRYEELEKVCDQENLSSVYRFPAYFEVRFVEHLLNLTKAVWNNLLCMQKHWQSIIAETSEATKVEKATARGFLRLWKDDNQQQHITCLMIDILRQFEKLQKDCQKSMITITDIELSKKIVTDGIKLMENGPYPGGYEEKLLNRSEGRDVNVIEDDPNREASKRRVVNSLVSSKRCWSAVRKEIVLSCQEFLTQRLDQDQQNILDRLNKFLNARNPTEMVQTVRIDIENLFGEDAVSLFTDEVVSLYSVEKLPPPTDMNTATAKLYHYLKISTPHSVFSKLVQTYISLTPHSSSPERAVSVHTTLKTNKQSCYSREALNSRMYIALNGSGTALFDPRPAVAKFLETKTRRRRLPDAETYQSQEYVKKFFSKDNSL